MTIRVIESPLQIYFGILDLSLSLSSSLFLTGKIMFTSLIDYFSKKIFFVLNNDSWNFHRRKQQYQLISLISQIFTLQD